MKANELKCFMVYYGILTMDMEQHVIKKEEKKWTKTPPPSIFIMISYFNYREQLLFGCQGRCISGAHLV